MKQRLGSLQIIIRLILGMGVAFLTGMTSAAAEPVWLEYQSGGCKVVSVHLRPNATFTWTGRCQNGYLDGAGTLQWFEAGAPTDRYIGSFWRGKAQGKGILTWAFPAARYEGDFVGGLRSGTGSQVFANGDHYDGDWREDQPEGKGVYVWINEDRYEGDFVAGQAQGKGVKIWADGTRYEGDFLNGQPHGKGVKTWIKGARYEGDFVNGQMQGYGVITLRNGRVFQGRWENSNYLGP